MSVAQSHVTRDGPDFEKYGRAVLESLRQRNEKLTNENIEREGERMAEMLVLDETQLTAASKAIRDATEDTEGEVIGNIYEEDE